MSFVGTRSVRLILRFAFILAITAILSISLLAQTAARIEGSVQDPSGAVIAGAKITATNIQTHAVKDATSNAAGNYVINAVQPGKYTVTVEATGFSKSIVDNLEVNVAGTSTVDFKLQVGKTTEVVEVQATQVTVNTADATIGRAITMKDIDTLPQLGRQPIGLSVFQPGVQMRPDDSSFSTINGLRQGSNNSTLDGIDVNDSVAPRLGLAMTANNTDSVGEFRIVTEGSKAEYGRSAGGQVELITRGGTNTLHGNAYDYLRNRLLNANDWFNNQSANALAGHDTRPKYIRNIWGGSIGGPIIHNKTFFFGNFQRNDTRQAIIRNRTVYTTAAKQGIFTYKDASGAVKTYSIVANDPRHIGIDPQMAKDFAMIPDPNNTDVGDGMNTAGFRFNQPNNNFEDQFTIKGDHNINSRMKAFLRWSWQRNSSIDTLNNADAPFPGQIQGTQGGHRWGYSIGHDWTITNNMVNEFRFGHQSATTAFNRPGRLSGPMIQTNLVTDPQLVGFAQGRNSPVEDYIDNLTWTHGNHVFKFGGKYSHTQQQGYNYAGIYPTITLGATTNGNTPAVPSVLASISSAQRSTYQSLYNDVLGRLNNYSTTFYSTDLATFQAAGSPRVRNHVINETGFYAQDDWKVSRNLTMNIGLRWELFLPPKEQSGIQATIQNPGQLNLTNTSTTLTLQRSNAWYKTDWNNIAPRLGFAYDLMGDGKTSIRGNYGIFFDRMIGSTTSLVDGNTPGFATTNTQFPQLLASGDPARSACGSAPVADIRLNDCLPPIPVPGAPALTLPVGARTTSIVVFNPNLSTGYVESWSLGVQREIIHNTVLDVAYVGNRGVKLFMDRDVNQVHINQGFLTAFNEIAANLNNLSAVSSSNILVKMFGSAATAVSTLGSSNFSNGLVGSVANTVDRNQNAKYVNAGLPQTYIRNFPQYNQVIVGNNDGRSYYDAMQVSVRRSAGALRMTANYTWAKNIDNITAEGNGFTSPIDNFNLLSNRGLSDNDHRQSFNASMVYTLPIGKGKRFGGGMPRWLDTLVGGWDLGDLFVVQDGRVYNVGSQRNTFQNNTTTRANFVGTPSSTGGVVYNQTGATVNGSACTATCVFYYSAANYANFSYPVAGDIGNTGRNAFRGPRYFDTDLSLVKKFKFNERMAFTFRAEAYNLLNNPNWGLPNTNIDNQATFGKITGVLNPRVMQLTARFDF